MKIIKSFNLDLSDLQAVSSIRAFTIFGDNNAEFTLEIKNEDNHYYNFKTKSFSATQANLEQVVTNGIYKGYVTFPTVTDNDQYDITFFAKPGSKHVEYNEVRFADGTLDINSSTGSNSLLIRKVIYQYTLLTVTISNSAPNGTVTISNTSDTLTVSRGNSSVKTAFSISCSSASTESFRIIKQPTINDVFSSVSLTVGSAPELLRGEDEFPTVTASGKINVAVNNSTNVTVDGLSALPLVGDKFFVANSVNSTLPQIVSAVSESAITSSVAISASNDKDIQFRNRKNHQWPVNNILSVKPGMIVFGSSELQSNTVIATFEDSVTLYENTNLEKTIVKSRSEASDSKGLKPTVVNGVVTVQPGNIVFNNQQLFSLAGETISIGGYGKAQILSLNGYIIKLTNLNLALTPITTTTTSAVSNSTSVVLAARDGIINTVSTVSGIGIDPALAIPTVSSGANATGAGTVVLSAAQTLESGAVLTFKGAGKVATITGNIEILKAGPSNATFNFDVEKLLTAT